MSPPIQKVRSAHEGERAESRRGWVLVCDRCPRTGGNRELDLKPLGRRGILRMFIKTFNDPKFGVCCSEGIEEIKSKAINAQSRC